jgi:glycosyltransferase involved in cell wall biosynthesis
VLASRAGSLPEVVGDAGRFFEPTEVGAIASAIRGLVDDPEGRARLARRAVERAKAYTWAGAARALLGIFEEVGGAKALAPRPRGIGRRRSKSDFSRT